MGCRTGGTSLKKVVERKKERIQIIYHFLSKFYSRQNLEKEKEKERAKKEKKGEEKK